jgi:hypothetical protein
MKPKNVNETCLLSGVGAAIFAALVVYALTGCAGMGVKAEMYRIDERREEQQTHRQSFLETLGFKAPRLFNNEK